MATPPFIVVFALVDHVTQLDFTGPDEVFWRLPGARIHRASVRGGSIRADSGLTVAEIERLADIAHADLVCVPGGLGVIDADQVAAKAAYDPAGLLNPGKLRGWISRNPG